MPAKSLVPMISLALSLGLVAMNGCTAGQIGGVTPGPSASPGSSGDPQADSSADPQAEPTPDASASATPTPSASPSDDAGALYVGGITSGTMDGVSAGTNNDGFVRKFDLTGQTLWTHQFHTLQKDEVRGLSLDANGNLYVVGTTSGNLAATAGSDDPFLAKLPASGGQPLFVKQFGTANSDGGSSVHVAGDRIFMSGLMYGPYEGYPGGATKHLIQLFNPEGIRQ